MELVLGMLLGASFFGMLSSQYRVSNTKVSENSELPPPIPKEPSNHHSGNYHEITSYNNCGIIEIQTWHYELSGCNSGFNLNLIIELPYDSAKIRCISDDSHNMKFQVFNPENPDQVILLIAHWERLRCGCYTWKWRVVGGVGKYITVLDQQ